MKSIIEKIDLPRENPEMEMCHASNILFLKDGTILVVYFAGSYEASDNVDIYLTRKEIDKWEEPKKISDEKNIPHWNPVITIKENGDLFLTYKVGKKIENWQTRYRISKDNGKTWTPSQFLVPNDFGGRGPVRTKILQIENKWFAGASLEKGISWKSFCDISYNEGKNWYRSNYIELNETEYERNNNILNDDIEVTKQSFVGRGIIQPAIWCSKKPNLHMFMRSSEGWIFRTDSFDLGQTWTKPQKTSLVNNNSGIDICKLKNGKLLIVHNPNKGNWSKRTPLIVSSSVDNGQNWQKEFVLDDDEGEFSYPSIISKNDNTAIISWTRNRKKIGFAEIKI